MKNKIVCGLLFVVLAIMLIINSNSTMVFADDVFSHFSSKSYILLDANSGTILANLNENERMPVASICKLMTTLITIECLNENRLTLDDELIASPYACSVEGSQAFLDAGSKYKVRELLKSVIVASANDSAIVLAEGIAGNENEFVKLMNDRAKELGMINTFYQNSTGLNTMDQYSTALDTAKVLNEISKYQIYEDDCKIWMDKIIHPSGRETELVNTNRLIRYYDYCLGGKTGYTDEAGYCLSSIADNGKLKLIAVTLHCKDASSRFSESVELFNYGFANYENSQILSTENPVGEISIDGGKSNKTKVYAENNYFALNKKSEQSSYTIKVELSENIKAPQNAGQKVGTIYIVKDGVVINEVNAIIKDNLEKQEFSDIWFKISSKWSFVID